MTKIVVITGGSSGIGRAIVQSLLVDNDDIRVFSLSRHHNAMLPKECVQKQVDVSDKTAVKQTIKNIIKESSQIDVLINNAGITDDGFFLTMSNQKFNHVMDVNLGGTINLCRNVMPYMVRKRHGTVCNIASISGFGGQVGQANYSASKGAIIAFSKALAKEYGQFGIRVNCVSPGFIETDMTKSLPNVGFIKKQIPIGRFGYAEEIANCVKFLVSQDASYVNGTNLVVDGGLTND